MRHRLRAVPPSPISSSCSWAGVRTSVSWASTSRRRLTSSLGGGSCCKKRGACPDQPERQADGRQNLAVADAGKLEAAAPQVENQPAPRHEIWVFLAETEKGEP